MYARAFFKEFSLNDKNVCIIYYLTNFLHNLIIFFYDNCLSSSLYKYNKLADKISSLGDICIVQFISLKKAPVYSAHGIGSVFRKIRTFRRLNIFFLDVHSLRFTAPSEPHFCWMYPLLLYPLLSEIILAVDG